MAGILKYFHFHWLNEKVSKNVKAHRSKSRVNLTLGKRRHFTSKKIIMSIRKYERS